MGQNNVNVNMNASDVPQLSNEQSKRSKQREEMDAIMYGQQ